MSYPTVLRARIIAEARGWIGTPYRHQASCKSAGADCLGLVRGVWRAIYGTEPETAPPYTPDWAERGGAETLLAAAGRHMALIEADEARPGDVLLLRMRAGAPVKHCAILSAPGRIIHAYHGQAVCETGYGPWRRRAAAAGVFPDHERIRADG